MKINIVVYGDFIIRWISFERKIRKLVCYKGNLWYEDFRISWRNVFGILNWYWCNKYIYIRGYVLYYFIRNRFVLECIFKKFYLVDGGDLDVFGIVIMLFLFCDLDINFWVFVRKVKCNLLG